MVCWRKQQKSGYTISFLILLCFFSCLCSSANGLVFPEKELKVFQFPSNMIPRIDGNPEDWACVPEDYVYNTDLLLDIEYNDSADGISPRNTSVNPNDLDVSVRVGWVKGLNRLYFLYEAYDNYWDFERSDLSCDMFEITIDADLSGEEFIFLDYEKYIYTEGSHAQNYHIFTPQMNKGWAMVWNCPPWLNKLPYMNCASSYTFHQGESGKLIMECWIAPFDYVSFDGPEYSVESMLTENAVIGLSWLIADWDGPGKRHALPSLSHDVLQVRDASYLRPFRLMPLENNFMKPFEALYSFEVINPSQRLVAFKDLSHDDITSWRWDFGDGTFSTEQNPIHRYERKGGYVVVLSIEGPAGESHYSTVWEVFFK